jgi:hypothetical protein
VDRVCKEILTARVQGRCYVICPGSTTSETAMDLIGEKFTVKHIKVAHQGALLDHVESGGTKPSSGRRSHGLCTVVSIVADGMNMFFTLKETA